VKILQRYFSRRQRAMEDRVGLREGRKEQLARDDGVHSGDYKMRPRSEEIWEECAGGWRRPQAREFI
jgi:hypothetical protein